MKILITGGAGYIGSHTAVEALRDGHDIVIVDSFITSSKSTIERIEKASERKFEVVECNLADPIEVILSKFNNTYPKFDAVIHFAALKSSPESVDVPVTYYDNNMSCLLNVIKLCEHKGIKNFIFSSSATVYGEPKFLPITEEHPIGRATTPYGNTKVFGEWILEDVTSRNRLKTVALRYFNPAGADWTYLIGESPLWRPNNLVPIITQSAAGAYGPLVVTGSDFPTPDGSAIRDYIHVTDLAKAHLCALGWLKDQEAGTFDYFNIGTGKGTSVMEMVETFCFSIEPDLLICEKGDRRPGDPAEVWCDASKAERVLGWKSRLEVKDILRSAWEWEKRSRNIFMED